MASWQKEMFSETIDTYTLGKENSDIFRNVQFEVILQKSKIHLDVGLHQKSREIIAMAKTFSEKEYDSFLLRVCLIQCTPPLKNAKLVSFGIFAII